MQNLKSNAFVVVPTVSNQYPTDQSINHCQRWSHRIVLAYPMSQMLQPTMKMEDHGLCNHFVDDLFGHDHLHCFVDGLL